MPKRWMWKAESGFGQMIIVNGFLINAVKILQEKLYNIEREILEIYKNVLSFKNFRYFILSRVGDSGGCACGGNRGKCGVES